MLTRNSSHRFHSRQKLRVFLSGMFWSVQVLDPLYAEYCYFENLSVFFYFSGRTYLALHGSSKICINVMIKKEQIIFTGRIAAVSGAFMVIVAILLILNYWQISQSDPLESQAMQSLMEQFSNNPDNERLQEDIRSLDLLARKAFFSSLWQIKTGSIILILCSIIFVITLRLYFSSKSEIELPNSSKNDGVAQRILSQKWLLGVAVFLLLLAFIATYRSFDFFMMHEKQKSIANNLKVEENAIEIIEIKNDTGARISAPLASNKDVEDTFRQEYQLIDTGIIQPEKPEETIEKKSDESTNTKTAVIAEDQDLKAFPTLDEIKKQHNCFRGPLSHGISYAKNIPTEWNVSTGKNILWKVDVPVHGYNSPIVWDDKVILAGGNPKNRVVFCYSKTDGKLLWKHHVTDVPGSPAKPPKTTDDTGLSASGFTTDGQRIYGIFGTGDILCIDMNGNRIWAKNIGKPDNHYGHSSSLISWEEKLFVQFDTNKGSKLYTLNIYTGEVIWEVVRDSKISWASPILAKINDSYQIILSSNPFVDGYAIADGKKIWSVKCMMGEVGPSPAVADGLIYAANEYAKLVAINANDNYSMLWENNEYLPEVSSPVAINGLLFIATSYGVFACYNAKTGDIFWEHESANGFYSSPMIVDGKVYIIDLGGIMYIMEASKELKIISEVEMGEDAFATPAFTDKRIYIRTSNSLYCIGEN